MCFHVQRTTSIQWKHLSAWAACVCLGELHRIPKVTLARWETGSWWAPGQKQDCSPLLRTLVWPVLGGACTQWLREIRS